MAGLVKTPQDLGAREGLLDDTAAVQAWLDQGGLLYGVSGEFGITGPVLVHSNTTIAACSIMLVALNESAVFLNANCSADLSSRPDRNIRLSGITFDGVPVALCGIDGLTVRDCRFMNQPGDALQVVNNVGMRIDSCEFTGWGKTTHDGPPGTYVGGSAIFCWRPSWRSWVTNNYVHDGAGGIWLPVDNYMAPFTDPAECIVCTGNIVQNTTEFGIVSCPSLSVVANNIMCDTTQVDVSGNCSENHGNRFAYVGNVHGRSPNCGAFFGNTDLAAIGGNLFADCPQALQISSVDPSTGMGPNPPNHLSVIGNAGGDINFGSLDGRKQDHIVATGNAMTTTIAPGVRGKVFIERNNL